MSVDCKLVGSCIKMNSRIQSRTSRFFNKRMGERMSLKRIVQPLSQTVVCLIVIVFCHASAAAAELVIATKDKAITAISP